MQRRKTGLPARWTVQSFKFELDPTDETAVLIRRHVGMRRKAHNWAVAHMTDQTMLYRRRADADMELPEMRPVKHRKVDPLFTLRGFRKFWNRRKNKLCVDVETGEVWWGELSKEAAANGIDDAVSAYWDWVASRKGDRKGPRLGFPKFKMKGRGRQSYRIGTGTIKLADRRHVQLPRLGVVRLHENARRLDRLVNKGLAHIRSATVTQEADGYYVSLQTECLRPQHNHKPSLPSRGSVLI